MLNVSEIVLDPDFAQPFTVWRKSGTWVAGRFKQTEKAINFYGTVTAAKPKDLEQVPEGDRVGGVMCFHSAKEIFVSRGVTGDAGTSDEIEWRGQRYRVYNVYPWIDFGYYKAIGIRMVGV